MEQKPEQCPYPPLFLAKNARETRKLLVEGANPNYCMDAENKWEKLE